MSGNIAVFGGDAHPELVAKICENLDIDPSKVELGKFANGETKVDIKTSVREKDVYVIQPGCGQVNDELMQLLILISACKSASASRVTAVLPYFCYSRQPDIPYTVKGAPLIPQPKEHYTFETRPGTPHKPVGVKPTLSLGGDSLLQRAQSALGISTTASELGALPSASAGAPSIPIPTSTSNIDPGDGSFDSSGPVDLEIVPRLRDKAKTPDPAPAPAPISSISSSLRKAMSFSRIPMVPDNKDEATSKNTDAEELFNAQNAGYKLWVVQAGTLIANLLTAAGADHVITMDLHDRQYAGFFDIPVDNLYCRPIVINYILHNIPDYKDAVVVSPDAGGAKRATAIADALKLSFALIHKERRSQLLKSPPDATLTSGATLPNKLLNRTNSTASISSSKYVQTTMLVGDVRDKVCIIIDDLVDTSYTITRAAKLLKDRGATKVYAVVTHGIFSGDALPRIKQSGIDKLIVSNTIPQQETINYLGHKRVDVMDVSRVFAEAIRRIHNGESISMLFEHGW